MHGYQKTDENASYVTTFGTKQVTLYGEPQRMPYDDDYLSETGEAALEYAAFGLPVFPCDKYKEPLNAAKKDANGKPIVGTGGHCAATTDENQIREWWTRHPKALIGMATGKVSGIDVLDLDHKKDKNGVLKNGFLAVPDWRTRSPVIVRTPSGGAHLWFKSNGEIGNSTGVIGKGVDTRGEGGYACVPPGDYRFERGEIGDDLPPFPADLQAKLQQYAKHEPNEKLIAEIPDELFYGFALIPNADLDWEDWNKFGMALWAATEGSDAGRDAFDAWSRKSKKYDADKTLNRWDHYVRSPPDSIGAGSIYRWAEEASPGWRERYDDEVIEENMRYARAASEEMKARERTEAPHTEEAKAEAARIEKPQPKAEAKTNTRAMPLQWHSTAKVRPTKWLIRNRLPEVGAGLLVGQWGMLKTFAMLDMAAHVMMGWDWTGEPVYRKCGVLCLAAEGSGSIAMRLAALVEHIVEVRLKRKIEPLPFAWSNGCPPLLGVKEKDPLPILVDTAMAAHERCMTDHGLPLGAICIDTMSSAGGFSDENDNAEAAKLMNVLRLLSALTKTVVIGVDHLGKNVDAGTRGASAKEANSDFVLGLLGNKSLSGEITEMRLAIRKSREGPSGLEIPVAPRVVEMGVDEHGNRLTSVVLDWNVKHTSKAKSEKTALETALQATRGEDITLADGEIDFYGNRCTVKAARRLDVLATFKANFNGKPDAARQAFNRALKAAEGVIRTATVNGVEYLYCGDVPF